MNIGNIDTSSTGKKNVSITYFGKPYNAVIDVVEVGLEKTIDAKNIKSAKTESVFFITKSFHKKQI